MKHPAERTAAYAAGLIHYVTEGYLTDPTAALTTMRKLEEMLKQQWMYSPGVGPEVLGPIAYPPSPDQFKVGNEQLYDAAFGQELPGTCPIADDKLIMIRINAPCRVTKREVNGYRHQQGSLHRGRSADALQQIYRHQQLNCLSGALGSAIACPQPQLMLPPNLSALPNILHAAQPLSLQDSTQIEAASPIASTVGSAGASAASTPLASCESQTQMTDDGAEPPAAKPAKVESDNTLGPACSNRPNGTEPISMFGTRHTDLPAGGDLGSESPGSIRSLPSSCPIAPSTKSKPKRPADGKANATAAGKSKRKGVTKVELRPEHATKNKAKKAGPLPEYPGIGNKPPIRYGKSTVFFSPATRVWWVKPEAGSRVAHAVKWGRSRKDQIENWEKVKAWLRKFN